MSSANGNGNGNGNGHGQPAVIGPDFVPDEAMLAQLAGEALRAAALPAAGGGAPADVSPSAAGSAAAAPRGALGPSFLAPPLTPPISLSEALSGLQIPGQPLGSGAVPDATASAYYFLQDPAPAAPGIDGLTPPLPTSTALPLALSGLEIPGQPLGDGGIPEVSGAPGYYFLQEPTVAASAVEASSGSDPAAWRKDFPALHQKVHGKDLVWLDNAATTQKPQSVIDAVSVYYEQDNSNVHRAAHALAGRATDAYEDGRTKIADFLGAGSSEEIVIVRGTTEAINLVAQTYGRAQVGPGDEIILTVMEHHSNIVPWQMLAQETGARIRVMPMTPCGEPRLEEYEKLLNPRVKIVGLTHVSNALGTVLPIPLMTAMAHRYGAVVVADGAQAVSHFPVDVTAMDVDFYAISGHKLFGPTGVGALYGKRSLLEMMPPWQGGGSMIKDVTFEHTVYSEVPYKFEAGTPIIAGSAGLGAAIDYLNAIGMERVAEHEQMLMAYGTAALAQIPGLRLIGTAPGKVGVMSFVVDWMDTEDLGSFLDQEGIAVRAGHHCAQPCLRSLGLETTVRPSLALYNTTDDIDCLAAAIQKARRASA
jgi:cysteine desulfurase/selenocysteine lyase